MLINSNSSYNFNLHLQTYIPNDEIETIYVHFWQMKNESIVWNLPINRRQLFPSIRNVCPQCCTCCVSYRGNGFIHIFNRLRRCSSPPFSLHLCGDSAAEIQPSLGRSIIHTRAANKNQQFSIVERMHVPNLQTSRVRIRRCRAPFISYLRTPPRDIFIPRSTFAYVPRAE